MPIQKVDTIWMDGEFVDWDDATIHVLTPTLHYGWGVFEGIRAYETDRGPAVFMHREHMERLHRSSRILQMDVPFAVDELMEATRELIRRQRAAQLLHPSPCVPGVWRDGPEPDAERGARVDRRLALGHLPRRRGAAERCAGEGLRRGCASART